MTPNPRDPAGLCELERERDDGLRLPDRTPQGLPRGKPKAVFGDTREEIARLQGRVATLQKALDDRYAADLKAAKAIFTATGRKWGFPDTVEIVAFYVAEVDRLESGLAEQGKNACVLFDEAASLRAKLDRATGALKEAIDEYEDSSHYKSEYLQEKHGDVAEIARLRAVRAGAHPLPRRRH